MIVKFVRLLVGFGIWNSQINTVDFVAKFSTRGSTKKLGSLTSLYIYSPIYLFALHQYPSYSYIRLLLNFSINALLLYPLLLAIFSNIYTCFSTTLFFYSKSLSFPTFVDSSSIFSNYFFIMLKNSLAIFNSWVLLTSFSNILYSHPFAIPFYIYNKIQLIFPCSSMFLIFILI